MRLQEKKQSYVPKNFFYCDYCVDNCIRLSSLCAERCVLCRRRGSSDRTNRPRPGIGNHAFGEPGGDYGGVGDQLNDEEGDDLIECSVGSTDAFSGEGNDTIVGNIGEDLIDGGTGNDILWGDWGSDCIIGGEGSDQCNVDGGNDLIVDLSGNAADFLNSGDGDDLLISAEGLPDSWVDTLTGGAGVDTFWIDLNKDIITDSQPGELIQWLIPDPHADFCAWLWGSNNVNRQ